MKILKRNRKNRKSFKYIKIYFSHGIDDFCREDREDFFGNYVCRYDGDWYELGKR